MTKHKQLAVKNIALQFGDKSTFKSLVHDKRRKCLQIPHEMIDGTFITEIRMCELMLCCLQYGI